MNLTLGGIDLNNSGRFVPVYFAAEFAISLPSVLTFFFVQCCSQGG